MDIRLELAAVDHKACVEMLLPLLVAHCAAKTQPNALDRFLAGLGAEAADAAGAVLERMNTEEKDKAVVWLVSAHEERMRNSANRHLAALFGAPIVRVGRFLAVDRPGSDLTLRAAQVAIDYPALLRHPLVTDGVERLGGDNLVLKGAAKLVLRLGTHLSNESLEKQGILLLNSEPVRQRLTTVMQDAVRQAGLAVTVQDVAAEPDGTAPLAAAADDAFGERLMAELQQEVARRRG
ncbi:MAG: hypothetical protein K6G54_02005 [Oscillospiraceae bacterium]|nr:hypothetical protein [Oscillospiraceae bacterium]